MPDHVSDTPLTPSVEAISAGSIVALILAASGQAVAHGDADVLLCDVDFDGHTVLQWWCKWLDAWGVTDRVIVSRPAPGRSRRGRRSGVSDPADLGRCIFVGGDVGHDPVDQAVAAMPSVETDVVLLVDADTLPPPVNPYDLVPTIVDAACLALGPARTGRRTRYAIDGPPVDGQVPVRRVIEEPVSASPGGLITETLGITGARRLSILAATDGPDAARNWTELHARWARSQALSGRFYGVIPPAFSTAVELAAARADFPSWNAGLARAMAAFHDVGDRR